MIVIPREGRELSLLVVMEGERAAVPLGRITDPGLRRQAIQMIVKERMAQATSLREAAPHLADRVRRQAEALAAAATR